MFQTNVLKKIKTSILCSVIFFFGTFRLSCNEETFCTVGLTTDDNMANVHCMLDT